MTGLVYAATDYNSSRSNKSEDSGVIAPGDVSDLIEKTKLEIMSDVEGEIAKQRAMGNEIEYDAVVTVSVKLKRVSGKKSVKGNDLTLRKKPGRTSSVKELDKSSPKAASDVYIKLGDIKGEAMESAEGNSDGNSDSSSSKAFMKIEGVVGESQDKALGGNSGAIAGIVIGAVASPDESNTDTSTAHKKGYDYYQSASAGAKEACAEIKEKGTEEQLKTCIDGHVTVLK